MKKITCEEIKPKCVSTVSIIFGSIITCLLQTVRYILKVASLTTVIFQRDVMKSTLVIGITSLRSLNHLSFKSSDLPTRYSHLFREPLVIAFVTVHIIFLSQQDYKSIMVRLW